MNEWLKIVGKMSGDYFQIECEDCGSATKNVYKGWDPAVPVFTATCKKCGKKSEWKLSHVLWEGLPPQSN
ncbi:hypothetical protein KJ693_10920 [bacterium]|nr:hypothetical protein [bacterium]